MPNLGTNQPLTIFYSYAHEDEVLRDELATHLKILVRMGLLAEWHDREIPPGNKWADEIDERLQSASIILLLTSADFLASDYCWSKEMTRALERYREGSAAVIPVILRACDWSLAPFASLQVLPTDAKPVVSWKDRDEAWTTIAREIRRKLEKLTNKPAPLPPQVPLTEPAREESAALQSTASLHALRTLMQSNRRCAPRWKNFRPDLPTPAGKSICSSV